MMQRWTAAAWCVLAVAGCNGGDAKPGGPSIRDQIVAAQAEPNPDARANTLAGLALQQFQAQDLTGSSQTFEMALRAVGEVQDPTAKAQAQVRLADALAQADNRSDARRELAAALRTAEGIQNLEVRANTLVELAFVQKKRLADATVAGQTFDSVAGLVEKLDQPEARAAVWLRLAQAHTDLSSPEEALRAVESASQAARAIADPIQSAKAILPLAALQSRLGQAEAAGATLDAALEVARQGTNPYSRAFTTADVAAAMLAAQRVPRAREVLQEARQAAEQVPQEDTRREALKKVDAVAQTLPAA